MNIMNSFKSSEISSCQASNLISWYQMIKILGICGKNINTTLRLLGLQGLSFNIFVSSRSAVIIILEELLAMLHWIFFYNCQIDKNVPFIFHYWSFRGIQFGCVLVKYHFNNTNVASTFSNILWQGGGWCNSIRTCVYRKKTRRGSSIYMEKQIPFSGILSNNPEENPGSFSKFIFNLSR